MSTIEADDRILLLRRDYSNAFLVAWYGNLINTKPHIVINRMLRNLKPHQLYKRILYVMEYKKDEIFHKNNLDRLMREFSSQDEKRRRSKEQYYYKRSAQIEK